MDIKELLARLKDIDISIAATTVRKWAHEGIITPALRYSKVERKGRGGPTNWPPETVEQVAAYWSLSHNDEFKNIFTIKYVPHLRALIKQIYRTNVWITEKTVWDLLEYHQEVRECSVYPTPAHLIFLVESYLIGMEKARNNWAVSKPAEVHFVWYKRYPIIDVPAHQVEFSWKEHYDPRATKLGRPYVTLHEARRDALFFWGLVSICQNDETRNYDRPFVKLLPLPVGLDAVTSIDKNIAAGAALL